MTKQSVNAIVKVLMLTVVLTAMLFVTVLANPTTTDNNKEKVEVKYTGYFNNELSFNVKFNNPTGNSFLLIVLDENGESLYKHSYSDKNFSKRFVLSKDETSKLTFLILQNGKESFKEKFEVNINTREIEDVIVTKG